MLGYFMLIDHCRCPQEFHASKFTVSLKVEVDDVDLQTVVYIFVC